MLLAVPLLYSVTERSPCLFKTNGWQEFTASYGNLTCFVLYNFIWNCNFPSSVIAPVHFTSGSVFLLICSTSNKQSSYGRKQSSLRFGCDSWRRHMIPIFLPLSSPRVVALHFCSRRSATCARD